MIILEKEKWNDIIQLKTQNVGGAGVGEALDLNAYYCEFEDLPFDFLAHYFIFLTFCPM